MPSSASALHSSLPNLQGTDRWVELLRLLVSNELPMNQADPELGTCAPSEMHSVRTVRNADQLDSSHPAGPHGLPPRTVAEIATCLQQFPQIAWVKLYGSRAMGNHWAGSDIDLAFSSPEDCSAALREALDLLPTPYLFDVTHWESLRYAPLREHIERVGVPFP